MTIVVFFFGSVHSKNIEVGTNFDWNIPGEKRESIRFVLTENNTVSIRGLINPASMGIEGAREFYAFTGHPLVDGVSVPIQLLANFAFTKYKQNSHLNKLMEEAHEFGTPYTKLFDAVTKKELLTNSIKMMPEIESPVITIMDQKNTITGAVQVLYDFFITRDHQTIILDTVFQTPKTEAGQSTDLSIKIVSNPKSDFDGVNDWIDGNYDIKNELTHLLAESIRIFLLTEFIENISISSREKTVRYLEGKTLRFERGLVLAEYCGRTLMRNLRGIIFSVPSANSSSDSESKCLDRYESSFKLQ